jgi:hypothetical protein
MASHVWLIVGVLLYWGFLLLLVLLLWLPEVMGRRRSGPTLPKPSKDQPGVLYLESERDVTWYVWLIVLGPPVVAFVLWLAATWIGRT